MAISLPDYQADAVFQPGVGGVFYNEVSTEPPSLEEVKTWLTAGDRRAEIGTGWKGLGYTSIEDLPGIDSETEGGEKMGVWEDPDFRVSPITSTDTVTVQPVQWSPVPIKHRFGAGATLDGDKGIIRVPKVYTPVEVALMVMFLDGDRPLIVHYYRVSSSPDGGLEPDREQFLAMPIKYTVLGAPGKGQSMNILGFHLQTADSDNDGTPDAIDGTPEPVAGPTPAPAEDPTPGGGRYPGYRPSPAV